MKVLQINCVHNEGSTGKIAYDIHTHLLQAGEQSVICYGRGKKPTEANVYKTCGEFESHVNHFFSNCTGIAYGGCFFSTSRLLKRIKREQPDIVHLHCLNNYFVNIYRLVKWLKKRNFRTVLTLHAEFMYTGGCGYALDCERWKIGCGNCPRWKKETKSYFFDRTASMWKKMKGAFDNFPRLKVVSVSPWVLERVKKSPILADKEHSVILNGVDTEKIFHPYGEQSRGELKKEYGIETEKIVFHATAHFSDKPNHIKGGYYLLELAKRMPNVQFVVAGECKEGISPPPNVLLLGRIADQVRLARWYSMADVTLLTSKRETFSMVTVESLCCGTPVVGFEAGGPERIALKKYSRFLPFGDTDGLQNALQDMLQVQPSSQAVACDAQIAYSKRAMAERYCELYREFLQG